MNPEIEIQAANCASRNHMLTIREDGYYCECGFFYPLGSFAEEDIEVFGSCKSGRCEL